MLLRGMLRVHPCSARHQLVQRTEISLRRRDQRIRIGAAGSYRIIVLRKTNGDLRLRIRALGDRVHLIELELCLVRNDRLDGVERRIDGAVPVAWIV